MSASEIIAEIAKMPFAEQRQVLDFLQNEHRKSEPAGDKVRYASDKAFEHASDQVLRERPELFRRLAQ